MIHLIQSILPYKFIYVHFKHAHHSHATRAEVLLARSATSLPMTSALAFQQRWHLFPCLLHGNETDISFNLNDKQITQYRVHIDVFEAQIEIILHLAEFTSSVFVQRREHIVVLLKESVQRSCVVCRLYLRTCINETPEGDRRERKEVAARWCFRVLEPTQQDRSHIEQPPSPLLVSTFPRTLTRSYQSVLLCKYAQLNDRRTQRTTPESAICTPKK